MKRINLILFVAGLLLLGSCNKDEATQEPATQGFSPKMTATADGSTKTKAGVVEDNANYATIGEQFYWSVGDKASVLFNSEKLDYTVATLGAQRNQANFTTSGVLTGGAGTYDVTALFPTSMWNASTLKVTMPVTQTQTDNTSAHLSNYMPMKAFSPGVTVDDKNAVDMSYKHLGAVVRILVWNNSTNSNVKLEKIKLHVLSAGVNDLLFNTSGSLADKSATSLTTDPGTRVKEITINLSGTAQNFTMKDGKNICEVYMALLPSEPFSENEYLFVTPEWKIGDVSRAIEDAFGIADLPFLAKGFEQGKSYYITYEIEDSMLP